MSPSSTGRRAEYARLTQTAIVSAARELFAEHGYFATTVNQIAERARVAPATVYAVCGGKQGLLGTLVDQWSTAPIVSERAALIEDTRDPNEVMRLTGQLVADMRVRYGDIIATVRGVAPHDPAVADSLRVATRRYRDALDAVATHLDELGCLGPDIDLATAADIIWFYFGYTGLATLVQDNGWSFDHARDWLVSQAAHALGMASS